MKRIGSHLWSHLFWYVFLLAQAVFLIWIVAGVSGTSGSGAEAHAQAVHDCADNGWQGLYASYQDCVRHLGNTYNAASDIGKGMGAGVIIGLWVAADIILGLGRVVYVLSRRRKPAASPSR